jgi:hypothetical protein
MFDFFSYNGLKQESVNQSIFPKTVSNHEIEESVNIIVSLYDNILVIQIVTIDTHLALNSQEAKICCVHLHRFC